jgi:hypothetical protein
MSKGELPIEIGESLARFFGKLLHQIFKLNWTEQWVFWEWFWVAIIGACSAFVLVALYKTPHA